MKERVCAAQARQLVTKVLLLSHSHRHYATLRCVSNYAVANEDMRQAVAADNTSTGDVHRQKQ